MLLTWKTLQISGTKEVLFGSLMENGDNVATLNLSKVCVFNRLHKLENVQNKGKKVRNRDVITQYMFRSKPDRNNFP